MGSPAISLFESQIALRKCFSNELQRTDICIELHKLLLSYIRMKELFMIYPLHLRLFWSSVMVAVVGSRCFIQVNNMPNKLEIGAHTWFIQAKKSKRAKCSRLTQESGTDSDTRMQPMPRNIVCHRFIVAVLMPPLELQHARIQAGQAIGSKKSIGLKLSNYREVLWVDIWEKRVAALQADRYRVNWRQAGPRSSLLVWPFMKNSACLHVLLAPKSLHTENMFSGN